MLKFITTFTYILLIIFLEIPFQHPVHVHKANDTTSLQLRKRLSSVVRRNMDTVVGCFTIGCFAIEVLQNSIVHNYA